MASYSLNKAVHKTLTANVKDDLSVSGSPTTFRVFHKGTPGYYGPIYVRSDGTDPGVGADDSYEVVAGTFQDLPYDGGGDIRLISAYAVAYSVEILN
jgi:hypothetical protein